MKLSIVVPCYNESENIPLILDRFAQCINGKDIQVVLVNNGSTDNSAEILNDLSPKFAFMKRVTVNVNQGYGFGILSGLKEADGDFLGWTHADMQTDPADVQKALDIIYKESNPETIFVKGNRKGRSVFDLFFTVGMSIFETILLGKRLWDINAQPTIFHRSFYDRWHNPPHDFSLDLYAYYMAKTSRCTIKRFPVFFPKRIHGESKWNTGLGAKLKFIKRTLNFSFKLKREL